MFDTVLLFTVQPSVCAERVTVEINQDDLSLRVNNPNWVSVCLVIIPFFPGEDEIVELQDVNKH